MKPSTSDSRTNVLERLRNQEKSRDWAALTSHHVRETEPRRWSAESGQDIHNRYHPQRRSVSPQYLPRLSSPPEYQHDHNLRRGKLGVVPPVVPPSPRKEAFVRKTFPRNKQQQPQMSTSNGNYWPQGGAMPGMAIMPYGTQHPHMVQNPAAPYPTGVFPVPIYAGYAPIFQQQFPYPGGVPLGRFAFGGQQEQHRRGMTRSEAATSIQRYFRGWRVRKSSRLVQLQWLSVPAFARRFTDDLIGEFLTEDIVPDLLIDVLSHKKSLAPHDPRYKVASYVCSDIINEDVTTFINQLAASVYYSQVHIPSLPSHDPLVEVCQELVNEVVSATGWPIVQATIDDMVSGHMTQIKRDDWLEDLILETIAPMAYHVATITLDVYKYECLVDELVAEVTDELALPVIKEAWRDVITSHRSTQSQEVSRYAEGRLLDSLCLQHLLTHLAGNNLTLYFRDYMEQIMEGLMCGVLTQQYMWVHDQEEETFTNEALKEYHHQLHTDLALDVILDELSAHLDEDMHDWREKQATADQEEWLLPM